MSAFLDTTRSASTDALAEADHVVNAHIETPDHLLRACTPQTQADVWSDVAQWMTHLAGRSLPLDASGHSLLAEAMHADCWRRPDHRQHTLAACDSDALRVTMPRDAAAIIAWLAADPTRFAE